MSEPQRKIIHCDCDCFYVAVEVRDNPALAGLPVAVGGSSDRRGVIATCSYEARAFGVRSAMATATALRHCPDLLMLPTDFERYREASAKIMAIYRDYTDWVEPLSLDEAYLDVTGTQMHKGSATLIAEEIRRRTKQEVGITVSAGVAPNKFLAKIASDWNKPDGLCVIAPKDVADFVAQVPVNKIHGVGKVTAAKLAEMGVQNCTDLQSLSLELLIKRFGKFGPRLYQLARGEDTRLVKPERQRKSVSVERTFPNDLPDLEACLAVLPDLLDRLDKRLGSHPGGQHAPFLKMKFHDFTQTTVEEGGRSALLAGYQHLCREAFKRGQKPVRLLGVGVRLQHDDGQLALFDSPPI